MCLGVALIAAFARPARAQATPAPDQMPEPPARPTSELGWDDEIPPRWRPRPRRPSVAAPVALTVSGGALIATGLVGWALSTEDDSPFFWVSAVCVTLAVPTLLVAFYLWATRSGPPEDALREPLTARF